MSSSLQFLKECASTQDLARDRATGDSVSSETHFHWVTTERQSSGRGRQGSIWRTAEQAMLVSCAFRWPMVASPSSQPRRELLPLLAGDALLSAIQKLGAATARLDQLFLKLPNDLACVNPDQSIGKLGGILVEARGDLFVVGWGVNLHGAPVVEVPHARSLGDWLESSVLDRATLIEYLRSCFESSFLSWIRDSQSFEREAFVRLNERMLPLWGRQGRLIPGENEAVALSLDESGALRVRVTATESNPSREVLVRAGEFKVYKP